MRHKKFLLIVALMCLVLGSSWSIVHALENGDLWMKDNDADTGTEPSTGSIYFSPDISVQNVRYASYSPLPYDPMVTVNFPQPSQNPIYGQANYVYVRVRYRSNC